MIPGWHWNPSNRPRGIIRAFHTWRQAGRGAAFEAGLASSPSLTDGQIGQVVDLVNRLEAAEGFPVDVEFAIHDGTLYLLQCRPITALLQAGAG